MNKQQKLQEAKIGVGVMDDFTSALATQAEPGTILRIKAPADIKNRFHVEHIYLKVDSFTWTFKHSLKLENLLTGGVLSELTVNDSYAINLERWQPELTMVEPQKKPTWRIWKVSTWKKALLWKLREWIGTQQPNRLVVSLDAIYTMEKCHVVMG